MLVDLSHPGQQKYSVEHVESDEDFGKRETLSVTHVAAKASKVFVNTVGDVEQYVNRNPLALRIMCTVGVLQLLLACTNFILSVYQIRIIQTILSYIVTSSKRIFSKLEENVENLWKINFDRGPEFKNGVFCVFT